MLNETAAHEYIWSLYKHILKRQPQREELSHWIQKAVDGVSPQEIFQLFVNSREYHNRAGRVATWFPPGHFYSPIVDPAEAKKYVRDSRGANTDLPGIRISDARMVDFWDTAIDIIRTTSFSAAGESGDRFYCPNLSYPFGDATILRAMIWQRRLAKVIEVGSGFSSACMLDTAESAGISDFSLTCIDPNPERLEKLLRPSDADRVQIIAKPVQEVPLDVFAVLGPGDLLFIDSTHVLKSGSDVCHELFSVLPCLAKGVIIHFHDCQYPFEYPDNWIFNDNRSWNEIYALRAFLMYNSEFEIIFWNSLFALSHRAHIEATFPPFLQQPGGSLWIEKIARETEAASYASTP